MIDVLVVGSGGAGLTAALKAAESGVNVTVMSKSYPTRAQTSMAQGGINASLGHSGNDSVEMHVNDTMKAAVGIADKSAVDKMCSQANEAVHWLNEKGVAFSRDEEGRIAQRKMGAASADRACHAQDYTGLKILHALYDECLAQGIEFINEHYLLNLIVEDNHVFGVTCIDMKTSEVKAVAAKSVIIATGGYSKIYHDFSTNAAGSTGDGVAAALRAGCKVSDLEFVQFHPTALNSSAILISESARGAGAYLLNANEERFTDELAPRDVVARAIYEELEKSNGKVYLDMRHLGEAFIEEEMPQERKLAQLYENIDPVNELLPIKPVAHYCMGGIMVDENSQSSVEGLYAVGECANHNVHGANRMGGNSLLEIIVFGKEAGVNAANYAKTHDKQVKNSRQFESDQDFIKACFEKFTCQIDFYEKHEFLGKIAYRNAGITRTDMNLKGVLAAIRQMQKEFTFMGVKDKMHSYNTNLIEFLEFGNMIEVAEVVLVSAISRTESRGAHYREDFPKRDDEKFLNHTISWKEEGILCNDFVANTGAAK
jgi:succinate dehydrogenase/fumarate reductase flavoprotein subunit